MLISEKYKFIFVHIQKTGGTSIMEALAKVVPDLKPLGFKHDGIDEAVKILGRKRLKEYYKFAFVRNPWSRLVSWYSMIVNTPYKITKLRSYLRNNSNSFEGFVRNCVDEVVDVDGTQSFAKNQIGYINSDGEIVIDFVGKYENLVRDFGLVASKLGLKNIRLPHVSHGSSYGHYSEFYTDETRDIVAKRFDRDINYFNYTFDRPNWLAREWISLKRSFRVPQRESKIDYMKAVDKGKFT